MGKRVQTLHILYNIIHKGLTWCCRTSSATQAPRQRKRQDNVMNVPIPALTNRFCGIAETCMRSAVIVTVLSGRGWLTYLVDNIYVHLWAEHLPSQSRS